MAKALSKTQKKIDNTICKALTEICEDTLKTLDGFVWLTHRVNYANFPASLIITCIFNTETQQTALLNNGQEAEIRKLIHASLLKIGVKLAKPSFQIRWDNEEACEKEHAGKWPVRLESRSGLAVAKNHPS